ncbi:MAG: 3'-5' exonuclease domain-containing protein 2 [Candidatus Azobacteroides sp.]|nr:3'-5' exonuclease domain-containing protein 2 [Candidatus Azobacteroides sp.]
MGKSITKEEIAQFTIEEFNGRIFEIQTLEETEEAVEYLSKFKFIGFDTETRPSYRKGKLNRVALLQLATDDVCFLFRLNIIGLPPVVIQLLSDPKIQKIGLSLNDDFRSLSRRMRFTPNNFVDLQKIVAYHNIEDIGLQKIYALLFHKRISKNQRLTNWEAEKLTEPQKKYAALDAWACLKIYEKLCLVKNSI